MNVKELVLSRFDKLFCRCSFLINFSSLLAQFPLFAEKFHTTNKNYVLPTIILNVNNPAE